MKSLSPVALGLCILAPFVAAAAPPAPTSTTEPAPDYTSIVHLKDGETLTGIADNLGADTVLEEPDGTRLVVSNSAIVKIETPSDAHPIDPVVRQWDTDCTLIVKPTTLSKIIALHEQFLRIYDKTETGRQVRASLERYQALSAEGTEFFGGASLGADRMKAPEIVPTDKMAQALYYYYGPNSSYKASAAAVCDVLKDDPKNTLALLILGSASFRSNDMTTARESWTKLLAIDPQSVYALNNLAVLAAMEKPGIEQTGPGGKNYDPLAYQGGWMPSWRQADSAAAMRYLTQALKANPDNVDLLNNVAFALELYTPKTDAAYGTLHALYTAAEKKAETQMSNRGLYLWGSTWLDSYALTLAKNDQQDILTSEQTLQHQYDQDVAADNNERSALDNARRRDLDNLNVGVSMADAAVDSDLKSAQQLKDRMVASRQKEFPDVPRILMPPYVRPAPNLYVGIVPPPVRTQR